METYCVSIQLFFSFSLFAFENEIMFYVDTPFKMTATIGTYNGWFEGMTFAEATAAANSNCCHCQQNLD